MLLVKQSLNSDKLREKLEENTKEENKISQNLTVNDITKNIEIKEQERIPKESVDSKSNEEIVKEEKIKEEKEQCKPKEETHQKEIVVEVKQTEKNMETDKDSKNKLYIKYTIDQLEKIHLEWKEIISAIENNTEKKWRVEQLEDNDKQLLKKMSDLVDYKIKGFALNIDKNNLSQNDIIAIMTKYYIFENKKIDDLIEEILNNQKYVTETSDEKHISENRKKFTDLRKALFRLGLIEAEEYRNTKLNCDIIKPISKGKKSKPETIEDIRTIEIRVGKEITIKYGKRKILISKKQMKEIGIYDKEEVLADLKKGDFKIIDEGAITECLDKNTIEPVIIYTILHCKEIKPLEQVKILNTYLKEGLAVAEDMKFKKSMRIIIDLRGVANSQLVPETRCNVAVRAKTLAIANFIEVKNAYEPNMKNKIKERLGAKKANKKENRKNKKTKNA